MTQVILKFLIDTSDPWNQKFQTVFLIMKQNYFLVVNLLVMLYHCVNLLNIY